MAPTINELAKETLLALKERKLRPTPENYTEIFEELSVKYDLSTTNKIKLEKYGSLLLPHYQQEFKTKRIRTLEEFITFLISILNRQNRSHFSDFYELLNSIVKVLQISKDKKIKDLANTSFARISKTTDSENLFLITKKWKELEKTYENSELDKEIRKFGISKFDDYESIIKKLLLKLEQRSFENFSSLIVSCLNPSLLEDLRIANFSQNLTQKSYIIAEPNFKNDLLDIVNHRVFVDNMYVQKNLNFFNENLQKIQELFSLLDKSNKQNMDFVDGLKPDENGDVLISFEDLKLKFTQLNDKINSLNSQIQFTQNLEERESWSVVKELQKLDENYIKYKVNYSLALFSVVNYRFIMEKYGLNSLNEIFVRFKKILKESCEEFDELWMIDERSYLIVAPGKSKEQIANLVQKDLDILENFRFIYKQDVIMPKIQAFYLDKQNNPDVNILEQLLEQITRYDKEYNESE